MKLYFYSVIVILILALGLYGFPFFMGAKNMTSVQLSLASTTFQDGKEISARFTCAGANISPELHWTISPKEAVKKYVLVVDDPDAKPVVGKTFVHWIALLPAETTQLPEGSSSKQNALSEGTELLNDSGSSNYGGPCPPKGTGVHTYRFTLFALGEPIENSELPDAPFTAEQCKETLKHKIVGEARITGTYTQG